MGRFIPDTTVRLERSTDQGRSWSVFSLRRRTPLYIQMIKDTDRPFQDGVGNLYREA